MGEWGTAKKTQVNTMAKMNIDKSKGAAEMPTSPREWYDGGLKVRLLKDRLQYYKKGLDLDPSFRALAWTGIGHTLNRIKDGFYVPKTRVAITPDVFNSQISTILDETLVKTTTEFRAWVESNVPLVESPADNETSDYLRKQLLIHFVTRGSSVSFGYSLLPALIRPFNENPQAPSYHYFDNAISYAGVRVEQNIRECGKDHPTVMNMLLGKIEVNLLPQTEYDERQALERAIEMEPGLTEAWLGLGYVHRSLGHNTEATNAFKMAIKFDPKNKFARQELGNERKEKVEHIGVFDIHYKS